MPHGHPRFRHLFMHADGSKRHATPKDRARRVDAKRPPRLNCRDQRPLKNCQNPGTAAPLCESCEYPLVVQNTTG